MKPNILVVVIDALRTDYLGCYGSKESLTKNIDEIAGEGALFKKAYSTTNSTDSSLTSIFSGKFPRTHGILNHGEQITDEEIRLFNKNETQLLPEVLADMGYHTMAVDWLRRWHKRGYSHYEGIQENALFRFGNGFLKKLSNRVQKILNSIYGRPSPDKLDDAKSITERGINLIKKVEEKPFLLFLHYWDTHAPYNPPEDFVEPVKIQGKKFELDEILGSIKNEKWRSKLREFMKNSDSATEVIERYAGAVNYVDYQLDTLIKFLKEHEILDDSLLIITSDHGESLTEHGIYFDHHGLYEESIRVPLIIRFPKVFETSVIEDFVQHIDIVPTILDLLDVDMTGLDGESLIPVVNGKNHPRSTVFTEEAYTQEKKCIRTKRYKYIYSDSEEKAKCRYCGRIHGGVEELYDLGRDPKERNNVVDDYPSTVSDLRETLFSTIKRLDKKRLKSEKLCIRKRISKLKREGRL